MSDVRDRYLACWNETDPQARLQLVAATWQAEAVYVDPLVEAEGHEDICRTIETVQHQFPAFVFSPVGNLESHHGVSRFQWGLGPEGEDPVVVGSDVLMTGDDGLIASVVGFLDQVPPQVAG